MDAIVRRRALLAATKVALSLTILGCSSSPDDSAANDDTSAEALRRHKDAGCASQHHNTCGAPDVQTNVDAAANVTVSKDTITCCKSLVDSEAVDGGFMLTLPNSAKKDQDILRCCDAFKHGPQFGPYEESAACCQLLGDFSNPACTPWGPPMPPAMPEGFVLPEVA